MVRPSLVRRRSARLATAAGIAVAVSLAATACEPIGGTLASGSGGNGSTMANRTGSSTDRGHTALGQTERPTETITTYITNRDGHRVKVIRTVRASGTATSAPVGSAGNGPSAAPSVPVPTADPGPSTPAPTSPTVTVTEGRQDSLASLHPDLCVWVHGCFYFNISVANFPPNAALTYTCSDSVLPWDDAGYGGDIPDSVDTNASGSASFLSTCTHALDGSTVIVTATDGTYTASGRFRTPTPAPEVSATLGAAGAGEVTLTDSSGTTSEMSLYFVRIYAFGFRSHARLTATCTVGGPATSDGAQNVVFLAPVTPASPGKTSVTSSKDSAGNTAETGPDGIAIYDSNIVWEGPELGGISLTCTVTDGTHSASAIYLRPWTGISQAAQG